MNYTKLGELGVSYTQIPNSAIRSDYLDVYEKAILSFLASHGKEIYPSREQIRIAIGVKDPKIVTRSLNHMRELNVISWKKGAFGKHNNYTLHFPEQWKPKSHMPSLDSDSPF